MKIKLLILLLFLILSKFSFAMEYKYNPLKAAMLSAFIPGGGQFYNDKKLKSFLVAGGEITLALKLSYDLDKKNYYYNKYKKTQSQIDYQNFVKYYEKKQSDIFWLGFYIILSATDAFVDAHLYNFNSEKNKIKILFGKNKLEVKYEF